MEQSERDALCEIALESAMAAGARYAEVRLVERQREMIDYKDGGIDVSASYRDLGIGIRALGAEGWGYGATSLLNRSGVERASRDAVSAAAATSTLLEGGPQIPEAVSGAYETPMQEDPFAVPLEVKNEIFAEAHARMKAHAGVKVAKGGFTAHRQTQTFRASNGSAQDQRVTLCGGGLVALAEHQGDVQVRSGPKSFEGNILQGGFECFRGFDLVNDADRLAEEAIALTRAEPTPTGHKTIVLDGAQLSLQIHESVGHPIELDRVFGEEISLAGASFALPEKLGFRYGSELVNLTADATTPYGPGTFGFDDEGTPATSTPIVEDGTFVGYLSGRDSAAALGRTSGSALRAESWSRQPIVRMINVNLQPGSGSFDDLIGGIDDGLYLSVNKSWSIDDLRLNFQFSCEAAYEIKGGKLTGKLYKNPVYFGVTPAFWGGCSAIAGPEAWQMWGWAFCGKGDPGQIMYVGHGCAPTRFDNVSVGHT
ncbi:MAG: TldD/PmbA family protein [Myxococcota bacterium]